MPRIGLRMIKTVIAVAISAATMHYLIGDTPFFACIGAVVSMERTMKKSFDAAVIRNVGTAIGGVIGIISSLLTENVIFLSFGVLPVIYIINLLKKKPSIIPGCIVFFAVVFLNDSSTSWMYGIRRITETLYGSMVGLAINGVIKSPIDDEI